MKDKYEYLRQMIKKNNIVGATTDEFMWTLCYVNFFYYDNNIGPKDIKNHWTDGSGDAGIDYVYYDDDHKEIYLIQGKSENNLKIDAIKNHIQKMANAIEVFELGKENKYKYNSKIIKAYKRGMANRERDNIKLVLITNTLINENLREQIEQWKNDLFNEYEVIIYGREEIEQKEAEVSSGEKTVKKGYLECIDNSFLKYSNGLNSGIVLNISAKSLRDLYQKEGDNGLFGYNLREYISNNKLEVDESINNTIKNNKENFWFYNNGITIACKSFQIKNKKLYLTNFSIINGAQTTTLIGKSDDIDNSKDFSIVCKVVNSENTLNDEFIKKISIASNSQKEIESRDLYANTKEQIQLQYRFRINDYPLAVTIKRGVKPKNYNEVKNWERIDNTKLGQIILSSYIQKPGSARNTPKCIFTDGEIYNSIFSLKRIQKYNYNALYDIVRMQYYFDCFRKEELSKKTSKKTVFKKNYDKIIKNQNEIGVLKNCGYTVISIITYLIKRKYFGLPAINSSKDEDWVKFINKEITTNLSLDYNLKDYDKNIEIIFNNIMSILYDLYENELVDSKSTINNPSNFFKSDEIYRKKIIPFFDKMLEKDPNNIILNKLDIFNNISN